MAHIHPMHDADPYFKIDPVTRNITNMSGKVVLVQYDHNSERFTFELPRRVEEHDMSLCNNVEVHFINGSTSAKSKGFYTVNDLQISESNENFVTCSWLISHEATKYVGSLNFLIRFECVEGDEITYAWSTNVYSGVSVSQGIYNTDSFTEFYIDTLEQWKNEVKASIIEAPYVILNSSTEGSSKRLMITVDDTGTITVVDADNPNAIAFYINGVEYEAQKGMTWAEYANSTYPSSHGRFESINVDADNNTAVFIDDGTFDGAALLVDADNSQAEVFSNDVIRPNGNYQLIFTIVDDF